MEKIKIVKYNALKKEVIKEQKWELSKEIMPFIIKMAINTLVLFLASKIFNSLYIKDIFYAFLGVLIINVLNRFLRPLLVFLTLPITLMSLGLLYPIVNVLILKSVSFLLKPHFMLEGFIIPFFISIFISLMNIYLEDKFLKGGKL